MLPNTTYDLITQLNQESKSLWRIEHEYLKNAEGNEQLTSYWESMKKDKTSHIENLKSLLQDHLKETE